jgi:hypothetical protein
MALDPAQLKHEAETILADTEAVLAMVEDIPLPEPLKGFVVKAAAFVKAVDDFLSS